MKKEKFFEVLAEGGSLCIERVLNNGKVSYAYNHNEFDPTDEGLDINDSNLYDSFEIPFQKINTRYPWYNLHLEYVHDDIKSFVAQELILQLNKKFVNPEELRYSKPALEASLHIKLHFGNLPLQTTMREITIEHFDGATTEFEYDNMSGYYYSDSVRSDDLKLFKKSVCRDVRTIKCTGSLRFEGSTIIVLDESDQPIYVFNSKNAILSTSAILSNNKGWYFTRNLNNS